MTLRQYLSTVDVTRIVEAQFSIGNGLSRHEIDRALTEDGETLPLATNRAFNLIDDQGKAWMVKYFKDYDKFGVRKLSMK